MPKETVLLCRKIHRTVISVGEIETNVNGVVLWSSGNDTIRSGSVHGNIGRYGGRWYVRAGRYETHDYSERLVLIDGFTLDHGSGIRYLY